VATKRLTALVRDVIAISGPRDGSRRSSREPRRWSGAGPPAPLRPS
jgi:hypothetical protein